MVHPTSDVLLLSGRTKQPLVSSLLRIPTVAIRRIDTKATLNTSAAFLFFELSVRNREGKSADKDIGNFTWSHPASFHLQEQAFLPSYHIFFQRIRYIV